MKALHENDGEDRRPMFRALVAAQEAQRNASGARAKARARYRRTLELGVQPRGAFPISWLALPALAVASFLVWLAVRPPGMTFAAGGTAEGRVGAALTTGESPLPLRFSDGSEVDLSADPHSGATMRVVELQRDRARVTLESGRATVHVVHRPKTRWVFSAGPYDLRVIGTRFVLAWDPQAQSLNLSLTEGRVEVTGGSLPEPVAVVAGQTLQIDHRAGSLHIADTSVQSHTEQAPPPADNVDPPTDSAGSLPGGVASAGSDRADDRPSDRRHVVKEPRSTWLELATAGKYGEALMAAEEEGFGKICDRAALSDLMALAQAARFAKNSGRAQQALQAVRTRFAADPNAEVATFLLGRLALEGRDYVVAECHFRDYLARNPRGPLAAEVHGRLLETLDEGGHHESARSEATRYLEQFPHGSYATLAKKILAR